MFSSISNADVFRIMIQLLPKTITGAIWEEFQWSLRNLKKSFQRKQRIKIELWNRVFISQSVSFEFCLIFFDASLLKRPILWNNALLILFNAKSIYFITRDWVEMQSEGNRFPNTAAHKFFRILFTIFTVILRQCGIRDERLKIKDFLIQK